MDAVDDLVATFADARLPVPPIPTSMRASLVRQDEWLWSTRDVDRLEMYLFREYPAEALRAPVPDYLAVSHGGHGANSYSINTHLVLGPLALFAQTLWGGVYLNSDDAVARMAAQFAGIARVVAEAERLASSWTAERRLLVLESTFRGEAACRWFVPGGGSVTHSQDAPSDPASVFDLAVAELARIDNASRA